MKKTRVRDVMTTPVLTVQHSTAFKDVVALMYAGDIGAVPVLDSTGQPCGMVCNAELLCKQANPDAAADTPFLESVRRRRERRMCNATTAGGLICDCPMLTISADAGTERAARALRRHDIRRLLVPDPRTGDLIGIVTRSDLLRVYLRPDTEIRQDILAEVLPRLPRVDPRRFHVSVRQGIVTLVGHVEHRSTVADMVSALRRVDGVVQIEEHVTFDLDDRYPAPPLYW